MFEIGDLVFDIEDNIIAEITAIDICSGDIYGSVLEENTEFEPVGSVVMFYSGDIDNLVKL